MLFNPSASGCRTSSPTCGSIRLGASSASALPLHDASGAYYTSPAVNGCSVTTAQAVIGGADPVASNSTPSSCVNNGHPEDKYGWALAGGAKFNLTGGDMVGFNVCYSEGAAGHVHQQQQTFSALQKNSDQVGLGWIADGVFANGTQIELTKVWSALAAYEHIWNPKWRTSIGGGYVNVDYGGGATNLDPPPALCSWCWRLIAAVPAAAGGASPRRTGFHSECRATAAVRTTASGKPIPAPSGTRCRSSISVCR